MKKIAEYTLCLLLLVYWSAAGAAENTGMVERSGSVSENAASETVTVEPAVGVSIPSAVMLDTKVPSQPAPVSGPAAVLPAAPGLPAPASSFSQRFNPPKPDQSDGFPLWEATDCGCVPDSSMQTYGFFRIDGQVAPAKINFEALSRVAYFSLSPDAVGNIEVPEAWNGKNFTQVAHRYATDVDLVISQHKWCSESSKTACLHDALELDKSYVLQNLIDEIVEATKAVEADGVTIDFSGIPSELNNAYHFFIKRLSKRLQQEDVEYRLNVIVENVAELERLFNKKDILDGLSDSKDYVNLFIIGWPNGSDQAEVVNQLDNAFWKSGIESNQALVMLDASDQEFSVKYDLILKRNFGGVGIWDLAHADNAWNATVMVGFAQEARQQDVDYVNQALQKVLPASFCKFICPNRDIISGVLSIVAGIYIIIILSAIVFFELRDFLKKYILYVIGLGLTIVVVFISIVICVPFWRGYQTEITLLLILSGLGYFLKINADKKREANYP